MTSSASFVLLALAGWVSTSQVAQASDIAQASFQLSNLDFVLTDLDSTDGISPAWTVTAATTQTNAGSVQVQEPGLFTPIDSVFANQHAFVTSDSVGADVTLETGTSSVGASAFTHGDAPGVAFGLTITPHTRLTVNAIVQGTVSRQDPRAYVDAGAELHAMDNNHVFGNDSFFGVHLEPNQGGSFQSVDMPYTFIYENTTALSTAVDFTAVAFASADTRAMPIPEPSTALLSLAGLGFVGGWRAGARRAGSWCR